MPDLASQLDRYEDGLALLDRWERGITGAQTGDCWKCGGTMLFEWHEYEDCSGYYAPVACIDCTRAEVAQLAETVTCGECRELLREDGRCPHCQEQEIAADEQAAADAAREGMEGR